jgi:hypothetical protein
MNEEKEIMEAAGSQDAWQHRSSTMKCGTCMHYMAFRCRRHAPAMGGFPAVYPQLDWCGDHKLDKETMRTM